MQELKYLEDFLKDKIELTEVLTKISLIKEKELLEKISSSFQLFGEKAEDLTFFSKNLDIKEEVLLFPGSFFPWHEGHSEALRQCPYKHLIIFPDRNPEKNLQTNRALESYLMLLKMKEIQKHCLYPGFLLLTTSNPTHQWMKKIKFKKKNLLLGDDSFMSIDRWIKASELITELQSLVVLPRQFDTIDYQLQEEKLLRINPRLIITYLNDHPFKTLASRSIRTSS